MIIGTFFILSLYNGIVAGWTYTRYWVNTYEYLGTSTFPYSTRVYPGGYVSPTSTNLTTTTDALWVADEGYAYYPITITDYYIPATASFCAQDFGCPTPAPVPQPANIVTRYFAPYTIAQPSTCTKTSFLYTASSVINPTDLDPFWPGIDIAAQATQSDEAVLVTTYVVTLSTNLGGQVIVQTSCDVYLSEGAAVSLGPDPVAQSYLDQCVDPRRYLCSDNAAKNGGCPTGNGVYPSVRTASGSVAQSVGATTTNAQRGEGCGFDGLASRALIVWSLIWSIVGVAMCIDI